MSDESLGPSLTRTCDLVGTAPWSRSRGDSYSSHKNSKEMFPLPDESVERVFTPNSVRNRAKQRLERVKKSRRNGIFTMQEVEEEEEEEEEEEGRERGGQGKWGEEDEKKSRDGEGGFINKQTKKESSGFQKNPRMVSHSHTDRGHGASWYAKNKLLKSQLWDRSEIIAEFQSAFPNQFCKVQRIRTGKKRRPFLDH
eukprot:Nk52_evm14s210 gene=Nk52_evmTU14s210